MNGEQHAYGTYASNSLTPEANWLLLTSYRRASCTSPCLSKFMKQTSIPMKFEISSGCIYHTAIFKRGLENFWLVVTFSRSSGWVKQALTVPPSGPKYHLLTFEISFFVPGIYEFLNFILSFDVRLKDVTYETASIKFGDNWQYMCRI